MTSAMAINVCVFCGSSAGARSDYVAAARELGATLVRRGCGLVFGGSNVGLMTAVADRVMEGGGHVTGIIPEVLVEKELAHHGISELHVVASMHERKAMMASRSDAFVALPGGLGTFEELFEVLAWAQLGLHAKPVGLLNTSGYYDRLVDFLEHAARERFVRDSYRSLLTVESDPDAMLDAFTALRGTNP